eukprot:2829331-Rhodomonas_salina.3
MSRLAKPKSDEKDLWSPWGHGSPRRGPRIELMYIRHNAQRAKEVRLMASCLLQTAHPSVLAERRLDKKLKPIRTVRSPSRVPEGNTWSLVAPINTFRETEPFCMDSYEWSACDAEPEECGGQGPETESIGGFGCWSGLGDWVEG